MVPYCEGTVGLRSSEPLITRVLSGLEPLTGQASHDRHPSLLSELHDWVEAIHSETKVGE